MKFIIKRTSQWKDNVPPCKEATKTTMAHWDTRTCTESYFNKHLSIDEGLWKSKGTDHSTTNKGKYIKRRLDDNTAWAVEINTLEELIRFYNKYGDLIITTPIMCDPDNPILMIEIYDDYRE